MGASKSTIGAVAVSFILALALGVVIGTMVKTKSNVVSSDSQVEVNLSSEELSKDSVDELSVKLSDVMLPEDEFEKLESAIFQTGMGLLMNQAQGAGIQIDDEVQEELKKTINEKYSRKYFSDMNAKSMTELSKEDLIAVLGFYHTESGQKFLRLSPKIIQTTMQAVQQDLSVELPKIVDNLLAKLKNKHSDNNPSMPENEEEQDDGILKDKKSNS